jgi:hypothetical protein
LGVAGIFTPKDYDLTTVMATFVGIARMAKGLPAS